MATVLPQFSQHSANPFGYLHVNKPSQSAVLQVSSMYQTGTFAPAHAGTEGLEWDQAASTNAHAAPPLLGVAAATPFQTTKGTVKAQDLCSGDEIICADDKPVTVRNIETTRLSRTDLLLNRARAPIRFDHGSLSEDSQMETLLIAPEMPVHVDPVGEITVLAEQLANGGTVRTVIPDDGVTYVTLHLSRPVSVTVQGLRLCFDAVSCKANSATAALTFHREEKRVFRPMR
ncbi:Hint domain-containing protein [Gymnodinialimonas hymeniacidonis]|uniref:Hint domain-containing protein n=1 Tax=Gymnodinialimonas hymeniacidonis TaxID=3126508 RepID=UPI0034C5EC03